MQDFIALVGHQELRSGHLLNEFTFFVRLGFSTLSQRLFDQRSGLGVDFSQGGRGGVESQFLTVLPRMERYLGVDGVKEHTIVITENPDGALYKIAKELGLKIVPHPSVGGRFSVLTPVGLFPAMLSGIDANQLFDGAAYMTKICQSESLFENPAYLFGLINYLYYMKEKRTSNIESFNVESSSLLFQLAVGSSQGRSR